MGKILSTPVSQGVKYNAAQKGVPITETYSLINALL